MKPHLAVVDRTREQIEAGTMCFFEMFYDILPYVRQDTVDEIYARMSPVMRENFLRRVRQQISAFDALIREGLDTGRDPTCWRVLREWDVPAAVSSRPPSPARGARS